MSLTESARNALWTQKHADAENAAETCRARLRTLFAVVSTTSLPPVIASLNSPLSPDAVEFLAQNDITKDHHFQLSSLPTPPFYSPLQQAAAAVSIGLLHNDRPESTSRTATTKETPTDNARLGSDSPPKSQQTVQPSPQLSVSQTAQAEFHKPESTPTINDPETDFGHQARISPHIVLTGDSLARARELHQKHSQDFTELDQAYEAMQHDYFKPLFAFQARQPPRAEPLRHLLSRSTKTLATENWAIVEREGVDYRILKRIYQLQNANKWPLRQIAPQQEPPRSLDHWDRILVAAKSMRTDFREERKWKISSARLCANWCSRWVNSSTSVRETLQVKASKKGSPDIADELPADEKKTGQEVRENPITLQPLGGESVVLPVEGPFSSLFDLGYDDVVFELPSDALANSQLQQIPSYENTLSKHLNKRIPKSNEVSLAARSIQTKVFAFHNLKLIKSRYDYDDEPENIKESNILPEKKDVALFLPEHKPTRDRLHLNHAFRPPCEFIMPSASFFECRSSSHWLWEDDQRLLDLVKEYWYNWSLISSELSFPSLFTSSSERRTPWECFERWVQLQGLPSEMVKTHYFRTYIARLDAGTKAAIAKQDLAERLRTQHMQQSQASSQDSAGQSQIPTQKARRTTLPLRVDRHRAERYLTLIDAMRKLAKKREFFQAKQQESIKAAQLRKANEVAPPRANVHTPQELSRIKHEREVKLMERHELYKQQMLAQQQNVAMARHSQQQQQQLQAQQAAGVTAAPATRTQNIPITQNVHVNQQGQVRPHQLAHPGQGAQIQLTQPAHIPIGMTGANVQHQVALAAAHARAPLPNGLPAGLPMQNIGRQAATTPQILQQQQARVASMQTSTSTTNVMHMAANSNAVPAGQMPLGNNIQRPGVPPNATSDKIRLLQQQQQQHQQRQHQQQQQQQRVFQVQQQRLANSRVLPQSPIPQNSTMLAAAMASKIGGASGSTASNNTHAVASHTPQAAPVQGGPNPSDVQILTQFVNQLVAQTPGLTIEQAKQLAKDRFQKMQQQRATALAAATGATTGTPPNSGQRPQSGQANGTFSSSVSSPSLPQAGASMLQGSPMTPEQQHIAMMQQRMLRQSQQQQAHSPQQQAIANRMSGSPSVDGASVTSRRTPTPQQASAQLAAGAKQVPHQLRQSHFSPPAAAQMTPTPVPASSPLPSQPITPQQRLHQQQQQMQQLMSAPRMGLNGSPVDLTTLQQQQLQALQRQHSTQASQQGTPNVHNPTTGP